MKKALLALLALLPGLTAQAAGFDCVDAESGLNVILRNHLHPAHGTRRIDEITFGFGEGESFEAYALFKNRYTVRELEGNSVLLGKALSDGVRYTAKLDERAAARAEEVVLFEQSFASLSYIDVVVKFDHNRPIPPGAKTSAWLQAFDNGAGELVFKTELSCIRHLEHPNDYYERL